MSKHNIAVALACVVFFTAAWGAGAAGATFTREILPIEEPWGQERCSRFSVRRTAR